MFWCASLVVLCRRLMAASTVLGSSWLSVLPLGWEDGSRLTALPSYCLDGQGGIGAEPQWLLCEPCCSFGGMGTHWLRPAKPYVLLSILILSLVLIAISYFDSAITFPQNQNWLKRTHRSNLYWWGMNNTGPLRCQKCGKPLGYVTVLAKGLTSLPQPLQDVKLFAVCMECFEKRK